MKIGILYICTGKYDVFWKDFYLSCEKYFIPNCEKHYFIYTDANEIYDEGNSEKITKIYQEALEWPYSTLMRFSFFEKTIDLFKDCDYLFFFNANTLFIKQINEDFLPKKENLLLVQHPLLYNKSVNQYTYDRNKKSLAYIPYGEGKYYVLGGLNGGKKNEYIKLILTLSKNIQIDLDNGIIALWHDESHINKYVLGREDIKVLGPEYMCPDNMEFDFEPVIVTRDKNRYGGHAELRGVKESIFKKIRRKLSNFKHRLFK